MHTYVTMERDIPRRDIPLYRGIPPIWESTSTSGYTLTWGVHMYSQNPKSQNQKSKIQKTTKSQDPKSHPQNPKIMVFVNVFAG